jgi:hypothetical protein
MSSCCTDLLIVGLGWEGAHLAAECTKQGVSHAATTTTGRDSTIKFIFNPDDPNDESSFSALPVCKSIIVTFPLNSKQAASNFIKLYLKTHPETTPCLVLLGTTSFYNPVSTNDPWCSEETEISTNPPPPRLLGEIEWLANGGVVLSLSGLYDTTSTRHPRNFYKRVSADKDSLKARTSVHFIHGVDVARALVAMHRKSQVDPDIVKGKRWLLTDLRVYDWWDLVLKFDQETVGDGKDVVSERAQWVFELMLENGVQGLPRPPLALGRALDSRRFWEAFGILPLYPSL